MHAIREKAGADSDVSPAVDCTRADPPPRPHQTLHLLHELCRMFEMLKHPICNDDVDGTRWYWKDLPRADYVSLVKVRVITNSLVDVDPDHSSDSALEILKRLSVSWIRNIKLTTPTGPVVQQRRAWGKKSIHPGVEVNCAIVTRKTSCRSFGPRGLQECNQPRACRFIDSFAIWWRLSSPTSLEVQRPS